MCKLAWCLLIGCLTATAATSEGRLLYLRLSTTLTSYHAKRGAEFSAIVTRPYARDGRWLLPAGTIVHGTVRNARRVGLALVHERASIDLEFTSYELPDGSRFPLGARLRRIENARETVTATGRIKGILAAQTPQSLVSGIWHMPSIERFPRSLIGLTGASGRIASEYSLGPFGEAGLFAVRCAMIRLPEPEIRLPAGTEIQAVVTSLPEDAPSFEPEPSAELPEPLARTLAELPVAITKPNGILTADLINVAFVGSRKELEHAFSAAGWSVAEPLTRRSFSRAYQAYVTQTGFATTPVSKLLYEGAEPAVVFEKSFNTITKRHHIRVWKAKLEGQDVWVGAATHDIGVEFDTAAFNFTHKIHPRIDLERAKVAGDLRFAGCAEPAAYVDRPAAARTGDNPREATTDGRLAVLQLRQSCQMVEKAPQPDTPKQPLPTIARVARRMMLEARHYVLRGNVYYWAYRGVTWKRHRQQNVWETDD